MDTWILNRDGMISRNIRTDTARCGMPADYHVIRTRKDFGHIPIDGRVRMVVSGSATSTE